MLKTPGDYNHQKYMASTAQFFFNFKVETCNTAYVGLYNNITLTPNVEVVLGAEANTLLQLRDGSNVLKQIQYPGLLKCSGLTQMWVSIKLLFSYFFQDSANFRVFELMI